VKFIRFAQMKMDEVPEGIVAIITNHSWLDNPTFKGMRKSLMATFDQIHVLDLHGSTKKKERSPDGSQDENVFDIEQGVAISILVKKPGTERGVWRGDIWGKRLDKYHATATLALPDISWTELEPSAPDWLFKIQDADRAREYRALWSTPKIFSQLGDPAPGIVTTQDEFAVSFSAESAKEKVRQFLGTKDEAEARQLFRLCSQDQWNYGRAKAELPTIDLDDVTTQLAYRPFDRRWTIWDRNVAVHRRERVMKHMQDGGIALALCRVVNGDWQHVFVADNITDDSFISNKTKERGFLFPLRQFGGESFAPDFRDFLDAKYHHHYSPEEILGYIYAILHAATYRHRYGDFLKGEFPRIPFVEIKAQFDVLSDLGWDLVQAHLLRQVPASKIRLGVYHGKGDHTVEAVRYSPEEAAIWINKTQNFGPVPQAVWDFQIGGYQVLDKYLKSRKGRTLSLDEMTHVGEVAESLAFTLEQMAKIDVAYRAAFPEQAG